jgi:Domain of unknown function (DUF4160)
MSSTPMARRSSGSNRLLNFTRITGANYGLKPKQLAEAAQLVEEHQNEIRSAWAKHFPR